MHVRYIGLKENKAIKVDSGRVNGSYKLYKCKTDEIQTNWPSGSYAGLTSKETPFERHGQSFPPPLFTHLGQ